ncbi:MAG: Hsp20/alpha crystallin family protein [Betaproteobacteria bacterium]
MMNRLTRCDPYAVADFDDLLRGFLTPARTGKPPVAIRMDVTENDGAYVVHAEIPGVKKDEIDITIDGNQVTIGAEVKREAERKDGERLLRSERFSGSLYRSFTLPVEVDEATSVAKYESGVLELTLAKKAAQAGRKLTVQ